MPDSMLGVLPRNGDGNRVMGASATVYPLVSASVTGSLGLLPFVMRKRPRQ